MICLSISILIIISLMAVRKRNICGVLCTLLFTSLLLFTLIGLDSLIDGVILDGVVLAPDTVDTWGNNPGSTNTVTLRNFTFYNLTNPTDFLYRNQKPVFHEVNNYLLQERSNFTAIKYSEDKSYIDYNYWLYFTVLPKSRSLDEEVTVLNLAPLGFWSQLENIDLPVLAIQGFGGLFVQMNNTIKMQAIGQGVAGQYLPNYTKLTPLCSMMQIPSSLCRRLYDDPIYGLADENNYEVWVHFSYYNNTNSQFLLYSYFNLKRIQLQAFDRTFERWCRSVDSILDNWYCGGKCQNYDLTILQLSSSGLTNNPPSGDAADSICLTPKTELRQNVSCQGYPELYSFYKYEFPSINNGSQFKDLTFSKETVSMLYSPYNGTLLNVGNLTRLFQIGNTYDSNKNGTNLIKLTLETHAQSSNHAIVIWQYVKYFAYQFVLQSKDKGTKKIAGLGGVFSQALYQSFTQFSQWILQELLTIKVAEQVPNCSQFIKRTIETFTMDQAQSLCMGITHENYTNYWKLISPCNNEYYAATFQQQNNLSGYQMGQLCNQGQQSILTLLQQAHQQISKDYSCLDATRCTEYELALKQFINSTITNKSIQNTVKSYPASLTGNQWNNELQEWEYRHFLNVVYGDPWHDVEKYENYTRVNDLLSFNKLFNGPMIQNLTLVQNLNFFTELYYFKSKQLAMQYIRYVTIQVGFGGFTQKRTINQLLFGYQDPFLKNLKEMDPMLGGDPSIQTKVALNQPNATLDEAKDMPQSMYTGYSDPMLTRIYRTYQNKDFITYNHTYYDGYRVKTEWISPYKQPSLLSGTDAIQEKPLSTPKDNQYVFIDSLFRVGQLTYNKTITRFGFDALRYTISQRMLASSEEYPPNANFYQSFKGFMNLSFMGLPLFASKNHFLGAQDKWRGLVELYDQSGKNAQYANDYDETQVVMQAKSGATFVATIYLQTSVFLNRDILFTRQAHMLPVFTIYRSGNMSSSAADQLLGDLRVAIAAPTKLVMLSVFGIIFVVFWTICCNMKQEKREFDSSLLSSTQEQQEDLENIDKNSDLVD